jgi:hypothetical protein
MVVFGFYGPMEPFRGNVTVFGEDGLAASPAFHCADNSKKLQPSVP